MYAVFTAAAARIAFDPGDPMSGELRGGSRTLEQTMSRGSYPLLLTMALSAPGAAHALGLGDIHIDSKLNQPLLAHIDIIGATEQELISLRAAVANRETFQQFGSDRPGFLSSAQFAVTRDRQRRPILSVRSSEPFTEPLVSFLVDLRWPNGNLVREYTLLLDPAGSDKSEFKSAASIDAVPAAMIAPRSVAAPAETGSDSAAVAADASPAVTPIRQSVQRAAPRVVSSAPTSAAVRTGYTVRANETLHGIARQLGARSATDVRRMMIALFRANPAAFDDNINRLHRDVMLSIPTDEQLASISKGEANREFRSQMSAWRLSGRPIGSASAATVEPVAMPATKPEEVTVAAKADPVVDTSTTAELNQRIQSLEQSLVEVKGLIDRDDAKLRDLQTQAQTAAALAAQPVTPVAVKAGLSAGKRFAFVATLFGIVLGVVLFMRLGRRKSGTQPLPVQAVEKPTPIDQSDIIEMPLVEPTVAAPVVAEIVQSAEPVFAAVESDIEDAEEETMVMESDGDTTMNLTMDPTVALKRDENLADLEHTAQHVYMPSDLNVPVQSVPVVERRKSVVDVLRAAIDREPHRRELKLKLLELYYSQTLANQASFLELAKLLARDRSVLATGAWEEVAAMGRLIAPREPLFLVDPDAGRELSNVSESAA